MVAIPDKDSEKWEYNDDRRIASSRCERLSVNISKPNIFEAHTFVSLALAR
jgi:hypothetical protein